MVCRAGVLPVPLGQIFWIFTFFLIVIQYTILQFVWAEFDLIK